MKIRAKLRQFAAAAVFWGLIQSASAQFTFVTNNGAITITAYTGSSSSATIPAITNGHPVTTIGAAAFGGHTSLTAVTLPNSITNIGAFAFTGSGLTGITIPGSVTSIGQNAFESCNNLASISVNATNPAYSSQSGVLFDKAKDTLIQYPTASKIGSYTAPGSVLTVANNAFYGASNLSSVTILGRVNSIGYDAFADCIALNSVYFSGNAPNVGTDAFYENNFGHGVTVNYLPGTVGWGAFSSALGGSLSGLATWYLPNPEIISFGPSFGVQNGQFGFTISWVTNAALIVDACTNLTNPVWLPISTNSITASDGTVNFTDPQWNNFPFRYYRVQTAPSPFGYTTMNGAITITGYTGSNPSVTIPAAINGYPVVAIGNQALGSNPGNSIISSVTIPNSVTNIGSQAFSGTYLTTITIPSGVIYIGQNAFASCYSLTAINVSAGNPAYSSLNGVLFDKAQDTLIQYPIALVTGNYIIPSTVTTVVDDAFYQASGFSSIIIPSSVTSIGDRAFAYCYAQNNFYLQVYFGGNAPNVGNYSFFDDGYAGVGGIIVNYVPGTTGWNTFYVAPGQGPAGSEFWYLPQPQIMNLAPSFGVMNSQFGFTISWATNANVVVDACSNLANPVWLPIATNNVTTVTGTTNFNDPQWGNYSKRFYRLRSQ